MKFPQYGLLILSASWLPVLAQSTPDVGSGAPTPAIQALFVNNFYRNGFSSLVSLPPLGDVKKLGTQALVQEFADASKNQSNKYALVMPNQSAPITQDGLNIAQMYPALYAYYTSVGSATAGFPASDTLACPGLVSNPTNTCQYERFDKPYALFVYAAAVGGATNFATRDPFYTKWQNSGGISTFGPAASAEQAVTSPAGTKATLQNFDQAAIFNITSGTFSGKIVAVGPIIFPLFKANGGSAGFLGLPTGDEITLVSGVHRQTFEGGAIEYTPGNPPSLRYPVQSVSVSGAVSPLKLNLGDTRTLQAVLLDPNGNTLSDRVVSWTTSNQRVVAIQPAGLSATITAVAGGSATIAASSEGKTSTPISVVVSAPCCAVGEGAPSPALQQAFLDAVNRNHIKVQLPLPAPVTRSGNGYVQDFPDAGGTEFLIGVSDRSLTAYAVSGALLAQYRVLGGPSGALGYPSADATAGGRQLFENQAALGGNPPQVVTGTFLAKWAALGYEAGAAGSPNSAATQVLTFRATLGQTQNFTGGVLLSATTGPQSGKVYLVGGLVLAAYSQNGGAPGTLGLPLNDEFNSAGKRRQDFEGGYVDYTPGDAAAQVHLTPRTPLVTATPATVVAGGRVRLAAGGFADGSTLRISVAGQPDFTVQTTSGAYAWELIVPSGAKSTVVTIRAADANSSASASGSYTIRALADAVLQIAKLSGDGQSATPGALLPQPLTILVRDDGGNPVSGTPVTFVASPGGQIASASAVTDANGQAQATLRLPLSDGVALATAQAGKAVVTFSAQAVHSVLTGFPFMSQAVDGTLGNGSDTIAQKGALLASAAAMLRYYQNRGSVPSANGFADVQTLNQFFRNFCVLDGQGAQICDGFLTPPGLQEQFVNLWRLGAFAGNSLTIAVENPDLSHVRDLLAQGNPVLLALSLNTANGPAGGHYVVATGVAADGGIAIMDPNPAFGRTTLDDYLAGFNGLQGTLAAAARFVPGAAPSSGFLVNGNAVFDILSPAGPCGVNFDVPSVAAAGSAPLGAAPFVFRLRACDGAAGQYQLSAGSDLPFQLTLTDLGSPANRADLSGAGSVAFAIARPAAQWTAFPQPLSFAAEGVVNSASFTPDIAPGGLFAVFGAGLARDQSDTTVEAGGIPALVVGRSPFQINVQAPPGLAAGTYDLRITSAFGSSTQPFTLSSVAPEVFQVSPQSAAILNQDNTLNGPDHPAVRGSVIVIYCTGLGAVVSQGNLQSAQVPVAALLGGTRLQPAFAGLTPGFVGLYQVNLAIPASTPPGLAISLSLQQGNTTSKTVFVTVQ